MCVSDLAVTFVALLPLTKKEMAALEKHGDQSKALMLDEFMLAMLQISINKYVATGKVCISV